MSSILRQALLVQRRNTHALYNQIWDRATTSTITSQKLLCDLHCNFASLIITFLCVKVDEFINNQRSSRQPQCSTGSYTLREHRTRPPGIGIGMYAHAQIGRGLISYSNQLYTPNENAWSLSPRCRLGWSSIDVLTRGLSRSQWRYIRCRSRKAWH